MKGRCQRSLLNLFSRKGRQQSSNSIWNVSPWIFPNCMVYAITTSHQSEDANHSTKAANNTCSLQKTKLVIMSHRSERCRKYVSKKRQKRYICFNESQWKLTCCNAFIAFNCGSAQEKYLSNSTICNKRNWCYTSYMYASPLCSTSEIFVTTDFAKNMRIILAII